MYVVVHKKRLIIEKILYMVSNYLTPYIQESKCDFNQTVHTPISTWRRAMDKTMVSKTCCAFNFFHSPPAQPLIVIGKNLEIRPSHIWNSTKISRQNLHVTTHAYEDNNLIYIHVYEKYYE